MFCVLSPLSCSRTTACYPSLETTTTRGLISIMSVNHYPVPLSAADTIRSAGPRVGPRSPPPSPKRLWRTNLADSLDPELARQNVSCFVLETKVLIRLCGAQADLRM